MCFHSYKIVYSRMGLTRIMRANLVDSLNFYFKTFSGPFSVITIDA